MPKTQVNDAPMHAVAIGILHNNPPASVWRPKPRRSITKHWTPEQARDFLALNEGDRLLPVWSAVPVETNGSTQPISRATPANRSRTPPHQLNPDASGRCCSGCIIGQRSTTQSCGRTPRARRCHVVLQPLQPRNPTMQREAAEQIGNALFGESR